jgi:hypothetical protein
MGSRLSRSPYSEDADACYETRQKQIPKHKLQEFRSGEKCECERSNNRDNKGLRSKVIRNRGRLVYREKESSRNGASGVSKIETISTLLQVSAAAD